MKHAYLIIAHNHWWQLEQLIKALDHPDNDIFIHIDKKAKNFPKDKIQCITKKSKTFIFQNIKTYWGTYSQVETEMFLFEKASAHQQYAFYHLISGSDFPLKSQDDIHSYFNAHPNENFVEAVNVDDADEEIKRRAKYFHLLTRFRKVKYFGPLFVLLDRSLLILQIIFRVNRTKKAKIKFFYGSNWCSLTHDFIMYLLSQKDTIKRIFTYVNSADELFVQTIISNSSFKIHRTNCKTVDSISRYIDWSGNSASPKVLTSSDEDDFTKSGACFARKFDETVDKEIILKLAKKLQN